MKKIVCFSLVMLVLLSGCIGPKILNHPAPSLKVDFVPFEQAGCPLNDSGYTRLCKEDSVLYALGCDRIEQAQDLLGGLSPAYPIAVCTYVPMQHEGVDPWSIPASDYFFNVGGPMPMLVRYVLAVNGEFRLIKNADEFRATFGPVESADEALSFSIALARVFTYYDLKFNPKYRYLVDSLEDTHVDTTSQGYVVHAFDYQFFGCGPHYYYAVDLNVTPDGRVTELKRTPIFRNPATDDLCQD